MRLRDVSVGLPSAVAAASTMSAGSRGDAVAVNMSQPEIRTESNA